MSVINKMLRDLDNRHAAAPQSDQMLRPHVVMGTPPALGPVEKSGSVALWRGLLWAVLLLLCAGGGWYFYISEVPPHIAEPVQSQVPAIAAVIAPLVAPLVAPEAPPEGPPDATPVVENLPQPEAPAQLPVARAKPARERSAPDRRAEPRHAISAISNSPSSAKSAPIASIPPIAPIAPIFPSAPAAAVAAAQSPAATAATPQAAAVPRRLPLLELLSHAQNLWRLGSREAAMELLRETMRVAEQDNSAAPGKSPLLVPVARELARMQLEEGHVKEALAMLTRLEPALSGVADVWALRGNAEQRLGNYAQSTAAYRQALKLRPNEPRWVVATAVSLAAQGQIAAATELAEKARAAGVLSPEVAVYLKELGVKLPER